MWLIDDFGNRVLQTWNLVNQALLSSSTYGGFSFWPEYEDMLYDHVIDA